MKPSDDAVALYNKIRDIEYSPECIEGRCKKVKKCNKKGYCVLAVKAIQEELDRVYIGAVDDNS